MLVIVLIILSTRGIVDSSAFLAPTVILFVRPVVCLPVAQLCLHWMFDAWDLEVELSISM